MTQTSERSDQPEPRIELRAPQPYLGIARQVTNGVPAAVDDAFPALYEWLSENGVSPAGPPFIRTLEIDGQGEPFVHVGPYRSTSARDLGDARADLVRWAGEHGIAFSRETSSGAKLPCCVEHFRIGPNETSDHATWETEFAYLIIDA